MKVHIVNPYGSAAMLRMVGPLVAELPKLYDVSTAEDIDPQADVNIHIPFHTLVPERDYGNGKHIVAYTHCNPGAENELITACSRADLVTAMSFAGRQELLNFGIDPKKIWVVPCAADNFSFRPRRILVVGYPQPNGRKRESILLDLAFQYDLTPFEFILAGGGWDAMATKLHNMGIRGEVVEAIDDNKLTIIYQTADVLLVTGYLEGGPLPLLEAMAVGLKVLSPRFGYASDYLSEAELYSSVEELMGKLNEISAPSVHNHQLARSWSWADYVAEYALLIGRMCWTSVDLYPERGMSRYAQLLDIIEQERPHSVVEIGTWNGSTGIRMLQAMGKYHPSKRLSYQGFDLFEKQTGEQFVREFSKVGHPLEVTQKRLQATGAMIDLIAGDTYDTIGWMRSADLIFVDGGHSEDTIKRDGRAAITLGKTVIFDDYYHENKPDGMGCNKFIDVLDNRYEVTHLPARTRTEAGVEIGMVKVKYADVHIPMQTKTSNTSYSLNYYSE